MVLNKMELNDLLHDGKATNAHRKDGTHTVVDSSVQDALGTAAYDTATGYISYANDQGKDEMYIVQFEVDYSNLLDALYTKTALVYRRGYSSVSWQVMSVYNLVNMEFYTLTVYRALGDVLQPYKELTWERGYMWKQQKALTSREQNHVHLVQRLQDDSGQAVKYYKDRGDTVRMDKMIDYTFTHYISLTMTADTMKEHPGHPSFPDYIRDKLQHEEIFGQTTAEGDTVMETAEATG